MGAAHPPELTAELTAELTHPPELAAELTAERTADRALVLTGPNLPARWPKLASFRSSIGVAPTTTDDGVEL